MPADWRAETKQCARCGATFGPRPGESPSHWATRRYCSPACAHDKRPPEDQYTTCNQCGRRFWAQNMPHHAAALTYYSVLALFQGMLIALGLLTRPIAFIAAGHLASHD